MFGRLGGYSPIGIDLGARWIKASQLRRTRGGWRLSAAAIVPRCSPGAALDSAEAGRIADVLERQGFAGRQVVLSVPQEGLVTSFLEVPPRSEQAPMEQIARLEFARANRFAPDSFEMTWWPLPPSARTGNVTRALAAGCAHSAANPLLDAFEAAGLDPVAMEPEACALVRACSALDRTGGTAALLDLGWSAARLALLRHGTIIYGRSLAEFGLARLHRTLAQELGLDASLLDPLLSAEADAEASGGEQPVLPEVRRRLSAEWGRLAEELRASFAYAEQQYPNEPVNQLIIAGGGAAAADVDRQIADALQVAVVVARPANLLPCAPGILNCCAAPALTAAVGLAGFPNT